MDSCHRFIGFSCPTGKDIGVACDFGTPDVLVNINIIGLSETLLIEQAFM